MSRSDFNKQPVIRVRKNTDSYYEGWDAIFRTLSVNSCNDKDGKRIIVVECYQGIYFEEILNIFKRNLNPGLVITSNDYFLSESEIRALTFPDVTNDRIFGYLTRLNIKNFINPEKLDRCKKKIHDFSGGIILVFGSGAALVAEKPSLLVYADMSRWEIQLRMRANEVNNLGISNKEDSIESKYKRGYFVDWRVCDRLKKKLMNKWDYILDSTIRDVPKMISARAFKSAMTQAITQPFSVVPTFDQGVWGGQWMKKNFALDPNPVNYSWCFNCIPEENSLLFAFGDGLFETPSINIVYAYPKKLLGEAVNGRFGDEFPIRFDFLDTMDGGDLSLQVHPVTEYIQEKFGIHYTQDESYYILDAGPDASVYLGLKDGINPEMMIGELYDSNKTGHPFDADKYVNKWPAKKHDHFLIPGGTVHCSGKNCLVLEISATTYNFTFKLWDWGRVGLDGKPRPIHIDHGKNVIQWDRNTNYTKENLINQFRKIAEGDGWTEEITGLHEAEFIETRRHWFTKKVEHNTNGGVNVLNLIDGKEIIVESPGGAFEPFVVHYAETFIIPASVKDYTIRPYGKSEGKKCATIKAFIRT
jgi:mannose-6-phosphate isomerase class I